MADTVAMVMEAMLPELDDLESKGYFSRSELKEVIKKRQDFEYSFKRRAALKRDFLRCVEFETKLEELRKHRKKKLKIKGKRGPAETGILRRIHFTFERATRKFKADLDLWLTWIDFCKSSNSTKQMSKVVTKALQRHGHVAALWVEAASWEFEHNGNVAAARALMQQGLRHCRTDEGLWGEYLRMELLYVARLRARREVLGLPNPESAEDIAQLQQQQQDAKEAERKRKRKGAQGGRGAEDGEEGADAGTNTEEAAHEASEAAVRAVLTGAVAHLVMKGAIAAAPRSLALRQRLLRVAGTFGFPGMQGLREALLAGVATDFADREEAWDLRARAHLPAAAYATATEGHAAHAQQALAADEGHQRCCQVFRAAVAALPTPLMHALFAGYLEERLVPALQVVQAMAAGTAQPPPSSSAAAEQGGGKGSGGRATCASRSAATKAQHAQQQQGGEGSGAGAADAAASAAAAAAAAAEAELEVVAALGAELLALYQAAHKTGLAGPEVYVRWAEAATLLGQPKVALRAVHKGCARWPSSAQVWSHRLKLELELRGRRQHHADDLFATLEAALAQVPPAEAVALWEQALQALGQHQQSQQQQQQQQQPSRDLQRLQELLLRTLAASARGPVRGGMGSVAASFLRALHAAHGLSAARVLCMRLLMVPAAGGDFFRAAIELEQQALEKAETQGSQAHEKGERHVRRLFEAAVDAYGAEDADLWLAFTRFEAGHGKGAGQLYWRATKALADPDAFIHRYRELQGVGS